LLFGRFPTLYSLGCREEVRLLKKSLSDQSAV
jgi:hypothetical protein